MEDDSAYEMLRGWFDEAEYTALGGGYDHQSIVVPDVGQGYLEAAAVYVDASSASTSRPQRAASSATPSC